MKKERSLSEFTNLRIAATRTLMYAFSLVVAVAVLSVACSRQPSDASNKLGQEFTLVPGQGTSISGEPLKIRFLEIVSDSRCPTGATCIWQGEVSMPQDKKRGATFSRLRLFNKEELLFSG